MICPSSARTKATRFEKPLPTNAASERAASAPGSSVRKAPFEISVRVGSQILGRSRRAPSASAAMTRPRAETSHDSAPRRSTATGNSGRTRIRSVCGKARSTTELRTAGRPSMRCSTAAPFKQTRLRPSNERSSARTSAASAGDAPSTSTDAHGEHGRLACQGVEPTGEQHEHSADRERPARGRKPQHVEAPPARELENLLAHAGDFAARPARPTWGLGATRPRRGTRPRAATRRRTAPRHVVWPRS